MNAFFRNSIQRLPLLTCVMSFGLIAGVPALASMPEGLRVGEGLSREENPHDLARGLDDSAVSPEQRESAEAQVDMNPMRIGEQVDMDLILTCENGQVRSLADLADGRPVILDLGYYDCALICGKVLGHLSDTLQRMDHWMPGEDYVLVVASIEPTETAEDALETRRNMMSMLPSAYQNGWYFTTDPSGEQVRSLADQVGFEYIPVPQTKDWGHPAALVVLTPEGMVSSHLAGTTYDAEDLSEALTSAAAGETGKPIPEGFLQKCLLWTTSAAVLMAKNAMKITGVVVLTALCGLIAFLFSLERKRAAAQRAVS